MEPESSNPDNMEEPTSLTEILGRLAAFDVKIQEMVRQGRATDDDLDVLYEEYYANMNYAVEFNVPQDAPEFQLSLSLIALFGQHEQMGTVPMLSDIVSVLKPQTFLAATDQTEQPRPSASSGSTISDDKSTITDSPSKCKILSFSAAPVSTKGSTIADVPRKRKLHAKKGSQSDADAEGDTDEDALLKNNSGATKRFRRHSKDKNGANTAEDGSEADAEDEDGAEANQQAGKEAQPPPEDKNDMELDGHESEENMSAASDDDEDEEDSEFDGWETTGPNDPDTQEYDNDSEDMEKYERHALHQGIYRHVRPAKRPCYTCQTSRYRCYLFTRSRRTVCRRCARYNSGCSTSYTRRPSPEDNKPATKTPRQKKLEEARLAKEKALKKSKLAETRERGKRSMASAKASSGTVAKPAGQSNAKGKSKALETPKIKASSKGDQVVVPLAMLQDMQQRVTELEGAVSAGGASQTIAKASANEDEVVIPLRIWEDLVQRVGGLEKVTQKVDADISTLRTTITTIESDNQATSVFVTQKVNDVLEVVNDASLTAREASKKANEAIATSKHADSRVVVLGQEVTRFNAKLDNSMDRLEEQIGSIDANMQSSISKAIQLGIQSCMDMFGISPASQRTVSTTNNSASEPKASPASTLLNSNASPSSVSTSQHCSVVTEQEVSDKLFQDFTHHNELPDADVNAAPVHHNDTNKGIVNSNTSGIPNSALQSPSGGKRLDGGTKTVIEEQLASTKDNVLASKTPNTLTEEQSSPTQNVASILPASNLVSSKSQENLNKSSNGPLRTSDLPDYNREHPVSPSKSCIRESVVDKEDMLDWGDEHDVQNDTCSSDTSSSPPVSTPPQSSFEGDHTRIEISTPSTQDVVSGTDKLVIPVQSRAPTSKKSNNIRAPSVEPTQPSRSRAVKTNRPGQ